MLKKVFKAFQYRDFRVMWLGACTSSIGTWMQNLAQSWLVYEISGSAWYLGLDAFLAQFPIMAFSLVGGAIADRTSRQKLLIISQVVQMTCAFTLAVLVFFGLRTIWPILCLSFIIGTIQAFGAPAYAALVPTLVEPEDLPNAIALNSIQFNVARVIGPMIGGLALKKLGATWCFALNGLSFLAVIASLLVIHVRFTPAGERKLSVINSIRLGIAFIRERDSMTMLIFLAFAMTLIGFPMVAFLPVFAQKVFHGGPEAFTALLSSSGLGAIAGALIVAALGRKKNLGKAALSMLLAFGVFTSAFALSTHLIVSCMFLFLAGAAMISVFAMISSLVQLITPDEMRGRVMSVYNVAFRGGMPIGSIILGGIIQSIGAPPVIAVNGLLLVVLSLWFLFVQRRVAAL